MSFALLHQWFPYSCISERRDPFSNDGIRILLIRSGKQGVTVMATFPAHLLWLQISWLQLQAVMAKVKWEKPGVCGGESSYSELCLRTRVHLGGCCWFVKRHLARHHAAGLSLRPDFCVQHSSSGHWTGCRAGKSHQLSFVLGTQ